MCGVMCCGEAKFLFPFKNISLCFTRLNKMLTVDLTGAICAGCCAVVKLSEVAPTASACMKKYFDLFLDPLCFHPQVTPLQEAYLWER